MRQKSEILADLNRLNNILIDLKNGSGNLDLNEVQIIVIVSGKEKTLNLNELQAQIKEDIDKGATSSEAVAGEFDELFRNHLANSNQLCSKIIELAIKHQGVKLIKQIDQIDINRQTPLDSLAFRVENFKKSVCRRNEKYVKALTARKTKLEELCNQLKVANPNDPKVNTLEIKIQMITDGIEEINNNLTALTVSRMRFQSLKKANVGVTIEAGATTESNIFKTMTMTDIQIELIRQATVKLAEQAKIYEIEATKFAAEAKTESEAAARHEVNPKTVANHAKQAKIAAETAQSYADKAKIAENTTKSYTQAVVDEKGKYKNSAVDEAGRVKNSAKEIMDEAGKVKNSAKAAEVQAIEALVYSKHAEVEVEAVARRAKRAAEVEAAATRSKQAKVEAETIAVPEPTSILVTTSVAIPQIEPNVIEITNSVAEDETKPFVTKQTKRERKLEELMRNITKSYLDFKEQAKISQKLSFTEAELQELCIGDPIIGRYYPRFQRITQNADRLISETDALMSSQDLRNNPCNCYSTLLTNFASLFTLNENGKRKRLKSIILERQNSLNPFPGSPEREKIDAKIDALSSQSINHRANPTYRRKIELSIEKDLFLQSMKNFLECVSTIRLANGQDKNTQIFAEALIKNLQSMNAALQADNMPFNINNVSDFYQGLVNKTRQQLATKNLDLNLIEPTEIEQFLTSLNTARESTFMNRVFNTDSEETILKKQIIALRSFNQHLVSYTQQTTHSYSIIKAFQDAQDPTFILNKRKKLQLHLAGLENTLKAKLQLLPQADLNSGFPLKEIAKARKLQDYLRSFVLQLDKEYEEYLNIMKELTNRNPGLSASSAETEKHAKLIQSVRDKMIERIDTSRTAINKTYDLRAQALDFYYTTQKKIQTDNLQKVIDYADTTLRLTCQEEEVIDRLQAAKQGLDALIKDQSTLTIDSIQTSVKELAQYLIIQIKQVRTIVQERATADITSLKADIMELQVSETNPYRDEVIGLGQQLDAAIEATEEAYRYRLTGHQITRDDRETFNTILKKATDAKLIYHRALNIAKEVDKRMQSKEYKTSLAIVKTLDAEFLRIFDKKSKKKSAQNAQNISAKIENSSSRKIDLQDKSQDEQNSLVKIENLPLGKINLQAEFESSSEDDTYGSSYDSDTSYESDSEYEQTAKLQNLPSRTVAPKVESEYTSEEDSYESSYDSDSSYESDTEYEQNIPVKVRGRRNLDSDSLSEKDSDIDFDSEPSSESDSQEIELKVISVNKGQLFLDKNSLTKEDTNSLNAIDPRLVKLWKIRSDFNEANSDYINKNLNFKQLTLNRMTAEFVTLFEIKYNIPDSELTDNEEWARIYLTPSLCITQEDVELPDSYKKLLERIDPSLLELCLQIRRFDNAQPSDKSTECYVNLLFNKIKTHLHNDQIEQISDGQNSAFTQFLRVYVFKPWRELKQWVNTLISDSKHHFFTTFGATKTEEALVNAGNNAAASLEEIQAASAAQNAAQY